MLTENCLPWFNSAWPSADSLDFEEMCTCSLFGIPAVFQFKYFISSCGTQIHKLRKLHAVVRTSTMCHTSVYHWCSPCWEFPLHAWLGGGVTPYPQGSTFLPLPNFFLPTLVPFFSLFFFRGTPRGGVPPPKIQIFLPQPHTHVTPATPPIFTLFFLKSPSTPASLTPGPPSPSLLVFIITISGQTILLNDRSDRSKPLRSIIDRKANLRSIICRSFKIVKWTGLLLWKQYIIITVRLEIWDNSHLL